MSADPCKTCNSEMMGRAICPSCGAVRLGQPPAKDIDFDPESSVLLPVIVLAVLVGLFLWWQSGEDEEPQKEARNSSLRGEAYAWCDRAIMQRVTHPTTTDIHHLTGTKATYFPSDNRYMVYMSFDSSNAFGVESTYVAHCIYGAGGTREITITEK